MINWISFFRLLFKNILIFWQCFLKQLKLSFKVLFFPLNNDIFSFCCLQSLACDRSQILAHAYMHFQYWEQILCFNWINNSCCSCNDRWGSFTSQKNTNFSKVASFWEKSNGCFIIFCNDFANTLMNKIHLGRDIISVNNMVVDYENLRLQAKTDFFDERWRCQLEKIHVGNKFIIHDEGTMFWQTFWQFLNELMCDFKIFEVDS